MNAAKLESIIGYRFRNIDLLERALTHRSWTHENRRSESDNESLEFLGDSVLGLAIAEHLFTEFPDAAEGELTQMKHRLVSMPTLASIASSIGLGDFIGLGRGEEASGGREKPAILADALEAVIGAVFIDGGYIEARSFIVRLFRPELKRIAPDRVADHKSRLQELLDRK
ncbi:ribonuclease III [Leptolyngbya sp. 7M]|uniref:ribonuclease III n=1 Tax=Leptolyngbya sp. 7M TaxID=2812896 RepID=UPI001B8C54BB|nr:ribonuclease III [Leptolyngbya sp. 7M]QYO67988.1 ribonuclease III [Leptolyngbya sp. 7M]